MQSERTLDSEVRLIDQKDKQSGARRNVSTPEVLQDSCSTILQKQQQVMKRIVVRF